MEGGDTQDQTQEVPVEKRLGPVNVVGWQPNLSQLWEPRIPGLLSWRPSPLSLEFVSLASERQQAIAYVPYIKSSGTYNQNIRHFPGNDEQWSLLIWSQQCAAVQLKRWMSFLWAESQWLSLRLVCILNLPIVIRGSGGELFSLEQEGCHFHFFPSALPPFGKDPHGAGTWIIWFCIRKSTVHPLEDKAFLSAGYTLQVRQGAVGQWWLSHCPWWEALSFSLSAHCSEHTAGLLSTPAEAGIFVYLCCEGAESARKKHQ